MHSVHNPIGHQCLLLKNGDSQHRHVTRIWSRGFDTAYLHHSFLASSGITIRKSTIASNSNGRDASWPIPLPSEPQLVVNEAGFVNDMPYDLFGLSACHYPVAHTVLAQWTLVDGHWSPPCSSSPVPSNCRDRQCLNCWLQLGLHRVALASYRTGRCPFRNPPLKVPITFDIRCPDGHCSSSRYGTTDLITLLQDQHIAWSDVVGHVTILSASEDHYAPFCWYCGVYRPITSCPNWCLGKLPRNIFHVQNTGTSYLCR